MNVTGIAALKEVDDFNAKAKEIDAYGIFKNNIEAIGGIYKVENDKNYSISGDLTMDRERYTFEEQWMKPLRKRFEIFKDDKTVFTSGDDGILLWNKVGDDVQSLADDINHRKLNLLRENQAFMDPNSDVFTIESTKERFLNGKQVYEIEVSNKYNDEVDTYYYDSKDFMLQKHINTNKNVSIEKTFSNYKDVAGMQKAHHIEEKNLQTHKLEVRDIKQYKRNILMDRDIFDIPKEEDDSSLMTAI